MNSNLTSVTSLNPIPPQRTEQYGYWYPMKHTDVTLYVPKGCGYIYSHSDFWLLFEDVREIESETAVDIIRIEENHNKHVYDIQGKCVSNNGQIDNLPKDIYIKNGKKVIIK